MTEYRKYSARDADGQVYFYRRVGAMLEYRDNISSVWQTPGSEYWWSCLTPQQLRAIADCLENKE